MEAFAPRILVLSPHPDDEIVGASALIGRARAQGSVVFVAHLSTGVPGPETLWPWQRAGHAERVARRRAEAEAVAREAGFRIVHLDERPTRRLRRDLARARETVARLILDLGIDALWVPAYEGGHSDHDAANALASTFAGTCAVFEVAEYTFAGGRVQSQTFIEPRADDAVIALSAAETAEKLRLLGLYASERGNLGYVRAGREAIRRLGAYDYTRPPHAGRLFYQRFQWVPFRHPRIDWTTPDEVSSDIAAFLEAT